jgi:hypothetical protein
VRRLAVVVFAFLFFCLDPGRLPWWPWHRVSPADSPVVLAQPAPDARGRQDGPVVWFTPAPASPDMRDLFDVARAGGSASWQGARAHIRVFKFYAAQLYDAHGLAGPNTYPALAQVQAFLKLTRWSKEVAIEVPSVKAFSCETADAVAELSSSFVQRVQADNAWVTWLALDEPFLSGAYDCNQPVSRTATLVADFTHYVRARHHKVRVGLIEPYPTFRPGDLETFLRLLSERGARPAFFHVDVDMEAVKRAGPDPGIDFASDLRTLAAVCRQLDVPFGFIIWGNRGDADRDYFDSAVDTGVNTLRQVFGGWNSLPDHLVFQSWIQTSAGAAITPANLPERTTYTHTFLVNFGLACLRGVGPCDLR